jgi:6-pyruvoyltetrahydropterin/6-carboxytetrahydropterin synthase
MDNDFVEKKEAISSVLRASDEGLLERQVTVVRKARFSAAHFLRVPDLSDTENLARFGPSSNPLAHGHNYIMDVSVRGSVSLDTGMVVNLKALKRVIDETVIVELDFKNLNLQVPFFENRLTTLENLSLFVWCKLQTCFEAMFSAITLQHLKIAESHDLFVEYAGGKDFYGMEPYCQAHAEQSSTGGGWVYLTRVYDFPASHRLYNPNWSDEQNQKVFQKCNNPNGHGHNYGLEVTVKGILDDQCGMVADIYELDQIVQSVLLNHVDHKNLNVDVPFLKNVIPTAENIVWAFWQQLSPEIPQSARLARLRLIETPNNIAEYQG